MNKRPYRNETVRRIREIQVKKAEQEYQGKTAVVVIPTTVEEGEVDAGVQPVVEQSISSGASS